MLRGVGYENTLDAEVKVIIIPEGKDPDDVIKEDAKVWQNLLDEALPIMDYTFNMVTAKLDLTTARGKALARDRLVPIIAGIKDTVRQSHYITKLSKLTETSERRIEAEIAKYKADRRVTEPRQQAVAQALRPVFSSPLEEYCLALLLQHPELKASSQQPTPEYFENSENREIFIAWQKVKDLSSFKEELDPAIREYIDYLATKRLPPNQTEEKYADCVLRLQEEFLKNLEAKRKIALDLEREQGGTAAELAKLKEQGIEVSIQLGEVFAEKYRKARSKGAGK
jgi:DNA primase